MSQCGDYNMGASKYFCAFSCATLSHLEMFPVNICSAALLSSSKALAPCVAYKRPWWTWTAYVLRLLFTVMPTVHLLFPSFYFFFFIVPALWHKTLQNRNCLIVLFVQQVVQVQMFIWNCSVLQQYKLGFRKLYLNYREKKVTFTVVIFVRLI